MAMIGKNRRMHFRQSKTVREIARATSLSRNTERKYLRVEQVGEPMHRRAAAPAKLTPFHEATVRRWRRCATRAACCRCWAAARWPGGAGGG